MITDRHTQGVKNPMRSKACFQMAAVYCLKQNFMLKGGMTWRSKIDLSDECQSVLSINIKRVIKSAFHVALKKEAYIRSFRLAQKHLPNFLFFNINFLKETQHV